MRNKNASDQLTRHHRRPRSKGGKNNKENISHVSRAQHQAWHTLFENMSVPDIVRTLNKKWTDPMWKIYCKR